MQVQTRPNPNIGKGDGHEVPLLAKKLLANDNCYEREKHSFKIVAPGMSNKLQWKATDLRICEQHKLGLMYI